MQPCLSILFKVGVIFSVVHTDKSCTSTLSPVCANVINHLTYHESGKTAE